LRVRLAPLGLNKLPRNDFISADFSTGVSVEGGASNVSGSVGSGSGAGGENTGDGSGTGGGDMGSGSGGAENKSPPTAESSTDISSPSNFLRYSSTSFSMIFDLVAIYSMKGTLTERMSLKKMPREELPKVEDGAVVDYLDEDSEIPTQRYAIISFISPERVIKQKNEFYNEKFIEWLDYDWKIKGLENFMAFLSKKYSVKVDDLFKDMQEFTKVHNEEIRKTDIHEKWEVFMLKHEKELENEYTEKVEFRTNVRGVKVRRVFGSLEEAQHFSKVLQRKYPRDNLYLGKVGCWLPWDPSEHMMPDVEYATQELNEMMRKYKENEVNKDIFFEEEKAEKIKNQRLANDETKRKNALLLDQEKADKGLMDISDLEQQFNTALHPSEGAIRDE